ncbi:pentatricopeptide repeat-containing protein [Carex littledalei]|uniref:Pentatricopeptide repeat-containing protein n=1 Tax=Carex littledalei TaxID=544730 RepID=A0A833QW91_9POAL|nr:pentatricopeptide repeat-containing protein [Carex littledalei]
MLPLRRTATSLRHFNKQFVCTVAPPTPSQDQPEPHLLQTSKSILQTIITKPQFESLLPSLYPSSVLLNPSCVSLTLSPLSNSHPLHSIRYLLFLSNLPSFSPSSLPLDSPVITSLFLDLLSTKYPPSFTAIVLDLISNSPFHFSDRVYHASLSTALRIHQPDLVYKIHEKMPGSEPGFLISAMCAQGRLMEAYCFLKEGLKSGFVPHLASLTKLVGGFSKAGYFGMVSQLLHLMIKVGVMPDTYTYQRVIHGLCRHGLMEEALRVFNDIKYRVQAFCRAKEVDKAINLYSELVSCGMKPLLLTLTPIIEALCEEGEISQAIEFMRCMDEMGLQPLERTNDCFIKAFCKVGMAEEGMVWLVNMLKNNKRPKRETLNKLIESLCLGRQIQDALLVVNAMVEMRYHLEVPVWYMLVEQLCSGSLSSSILVLDEISAAE